MSCASSVPLCSSKTVASTLFLIPVVTIYLLMQKQFVAGLKVGAVKCQANPALEVLMQTIKCLFELINGISTYDE